MPRSMAIIQARAGSTRLPGKVMYPLDGRHVLDHVVTRVASSELVDDTIVATSTTNPDDVIAEYASTFGADVVRGSESNVLARFEAAIEAYEPDIIVRVTADCPLLSPTFIDAAIRRIRDHGAEYVSAGIDRTFPRGVTCEAFDTESFERVRLNASEPHHREHVTPYYRENPEEFELANLTSESVFDGAQLQNRTDLRLTLDEPADYQLLETVYRNVAYENLLDVAEAIRYIDENGLGEINEHVKQKTI